MVSETTDIAALLHDRTRLDILLTLVEDRRDHPDDRGLAFSELFARTETEDKGNFNYHLDQVTGSLVQKTDGTYSLTQQGEAVLGGVIAGRFADDRIQTRIEEPCPTCEQQLLLDVGPGRLDLRCPDDHLRFQTCLAPGVLEDRTPEEVVSLAIVQWQEVVELAHSGACIHCYGHETGEVYLHDHEGDQFPVYRSFCSQCGHQFRVPAGALIIRHPAVVAAYHRVDVDIRTKAPWELEFCSPPAPDIRSTDPLRIAIEVSPGDGSVELVLDDRGEVLTVRGDAFAHPG
ncbi:MAG: hypothetical protein ABEJ57_06010 [Halobacteriaceae archaeon]